MKTLKERLEDIGGYAALDPVETLEMAADIALVVAEFYKETEPRAVSSIRSLENAVDALRAAVSAVYDGEVQ